MNIPPNNFRPLQLVSSSKGPAKIYRSTEVCEEHHTILQWLTETVGIKSYIDLRLEAELSPLGLMDEYFISREPREMSLEQLSKDSLQTDKRYRYHVPLSILNIQNILNYSMIEYYCMILDQCKDHFKVLFSVMLNENCFPILITCKLGKDRTGVVVAMVMQLSGVSDQTIINDYVLSEKSYLHFKEKVPEGVEDLNNEILISSPQTMEEFLAYLQEKYGGAEEYLQVCGLTKREVEQIKINLSS